MSPFAWGFCLGVLLMIGLFVGGLVMAAGELEARGNRGPR